VLACRDPVARAPDLAGEVARALT